MATLIARLPSRTTTFVLVCVAHALVLWAIWRVNPTLVQEVAGFTTETFLIFEPADHGAKNPHPAAPVPVQRRAAPAAGMAGAASPAPLMTPSPDSTAITLPSAPAAPVDWNAALSGAARSTLEQEKHTQEQLGALMRKYTIEDDPRNPHAGPDSHFRWYEAGTHRIDTRSPIPLLHLNDRCLLIAFVLPACLIGHIETHGDLFEGAAAVHDEKLAVPRPNEVP